MQVIQQLQNTAITLLVFFALLFLYTKLAGPISFSINSVTTQKSDSFQVTGEGKVETKPDLATLTAGVSSQGATVKVVQDSINQNINKVSEAVKSLGIDSNDIQTTNYNINPQYDFSGGNQRIIGYQANTSLMIKIRNLDKANDILDAVTKAGANTVGGLSFEVANPTQAENEARAKAVADAKSKAENAASVAGFRLGKLINYSESFADGVVPMPLRAVGNTDLKEATTQVEPGSNEVRVVVTLSYEVQ